MAELKSVGLDVGTTTTQLVVSRLTVENRASSFAVPEMEIGSREILYQSPVYFTPLLGENLVDGEGVRKILEREYMAAGIRPEQVDTGAVIITGETSRKENARAVLDALAELAGEFVVATAGPDLESVLAAKGAGAVALSEKEGAPVLHIDIGGGTSNLAWIVNGKIVRTGCMNVGGRLLKFEGGAVTYVSPVLRGLTDLQVGDHPAIGQVEDIARSLVRGLEMAAGLREPTQLLEQLWTKEGAIPSPGERGDRAAVGEEWRTLEQGKSLETGDHLETIARIPHPTSLRSATFPPGEGMQRWVISFSGGVADCIETAHPVGTFGDMGVELGQAIRESRLCQGRYALGQQTIRATVIGAGCHSAQLSGSTVFCRDVALPLKNLPVAVFSREEQAAEELSEIIARRLATFDTTPVLALPGAVCGYDRVSRLAEQIAAGVGENPVYVCLEADMAKALGQALGLRLPGARILCIDRVRLTGECFLDVGEPVGPAFPVVVKTLVLQEGVNL